MGMGVAMPPTSAYLLYKKEVNQDQQLFWNRRCEVIGTIFQVGKISQIKIFSTPMHFTQIDLLI